MVGSLSEGERQRLAALFAATANALLVMFVLAVALRLLPAKLPDPFWLLASTGAPTRTEILRLGPLTAGAAVVRGQRFQPHRSAGGTVNGRPWQSKSALLPGIDQRHPGGLEVGQVAGHHRQAMHHGRGGDQAIAKAGSTA